MSAEPELEVTQELKPVSAEMWDTHVEWCLKNGRDPEEAMRGYVRIDACEVAGDTTEGMLEATKPTPVERQEQHQDRVREEIAAHRRFELPEAILLAMTDPMRALYWHCRAQEKGQQGAAGEFYLSGRRAARSFGSPRRRTGQDYLDLHVAAGVIELAQLGGFRGTINFDSRYRLVPADQVNVERAVSAYKAQAQALWARSKVLSGSRPPRSTP